MLPPLSRFNLARTCQNNFRCTRPPFTDQCQLLGKVRIKVKETRESLVRLQIARSSQIHALGPRDGENRIASDGRNFHVFAVLHAIVLSHHSDVHRHGMASAKKEFIPETTAFAIVKILCQRFFSFRSNSGQHGKGAE